MTTLPDLYVGKVVHFVGVNDLVHGRHLPTIVVRILENQVNRVVLTIFSDEVERGLRGVSLPVAARIADALGVMPSELMTMQREPITPRVRVDRRRRPLPPE